MVEDTSHLWFKIRFDRQPGGPIGAPSEAAPASPSPSRPLARHFLTIAKRPSWAGTARSSEVICPSGRLESLGFGRGE